MVKEQIFFVLPDKFLSVESHVEGNFPQRWNTNLCKY